MSGESKIEEAQGCGGFLAGLLIGLFILSLIVVLAWNVGLYGAHIVDNKIDFWTAVGLAVLLTILRSIFGRRTAA